MQSIALLGFGLHTIVSLVVGLRLAAIARRTRRFPELALSLTTLLGTVIGYPLALLAIGLERGGLPGVAPLFFLAASVMMTGVSMNYFFTWRVFRPDEPWAVVLCGLGVWMLAAPIGAVAVHIGFHGIDAGIQSSFVWVALAVGAALGGYAWTAFESFRYYLSSRRRLRLGLIEASVSNRFLLWSLASSGFLAIVITAGITVLLGQNPLQSAGFSLAVGVLGLVNSACNVLCFMPPRWYLNWLSAPQQA
ncbi:MAG TPA: hypothetical protein VMS55_25495 [Myxococcota bacterium]|nr:hypothetical protein [Myxococcota bacterium]